MKIGFIMDPIDSIKVDQDTTFAIMLESQKRGHEVHYIYPENMWAKKEKVYAYTTQVKLERSKNYYQDINNSKQDLSSFDVLMMRKDPPFDMEYIYATYLLSLLKKSVKIINDPDGVRKANEKAFILNFPEAIPNTILSKNKTILKDFLLECDGKMIIKPLDKKGGEGIFLINSDDKNTDPLLDVSTNFCKTTIMAQKFIPEAKFGDKRILIINGKISGAFLRVPSEDDYRGNISAGAKSVSCEVTDRDKEICEMIKQPLLDNGLIFVGIDILGNYLSEINVTSPMGVREIYKLEGVKPEEKLLDYFESLK